MTGDDVRFDAILEVLISYALRDFSPRVDVSERQDVVDAVATGINMLAEELHGEIVSRHELESAYARLQETQSQLLVAEKFNGDRAARDGCRARAQQSRHVGAARTR